MSAFILFSFHQMCLTAAAECQKYFHRQKMALLLNNLGLNYGNPKNFVNNDGIDYLLCGAVVDEKFFLTSIMIRVNEIGLDSPEVLLNSSRLGHVYQALYTRTLLRLL